VVNTLQKRNEEKKKNKIVEIAKEIEDHRS